MRMSWFPPADLPVHYFSPGTDEEAAAVLSGAVGNVLHRLIGQRENEATWLVAKRIADAALAGVIVPFESVPASDNAHAALEAIDRHIAAAQAAADDAATAAGPSPPSAVLQYAYCAMWTGCWLRTVSQPATQPAVVANQLFRQYFSMMGEGTQDQSHAAEWQRRLSMRDFHLPVHTAVRHWETAGVRCDTFLIVCIQQALGFFGASYLPEIVGFNWAWQAIDSSGAFQVAAQEIPLDATFARDIAVEYLAGWQDDPAQDAIARERVTRGALLAVALRRLQLRILQDCLADACVSPEHDVAMIFRRHYQFAGPQHGNVKVNGKRLVDIFGAPDFDVLAFVREFKQSHWACQGEEGRYRFLDAIRFGGPMFGIFSEGETRTISNWLSTRSAGESHASPRTAAAGSHTLAAVLRHPSHGIVFEKSPVSADCREDFYKLINIERFPNFLTQARTLAGAALTLASGTVWNSKLTRYTNAAAFKWSPQALQQRVDEIYRHKLQAPCRPVETMPSKDEVIFQQKTYTLGNLIDGAWLHRLDPVVSNYPGAWEMFAIYADEMGRGEQNKNHIALIYQVLESMEIALPHIATRAFCDQDEILDDFYPFAIFQLALALFPHQHYPAILGYNLAIEMFGLGELRKQEIEKLRYWKISPIYEVTHLSIDNVSSGHVKLAADAITAYMETAEQYVDVHALDATFGAVWAGYGAFARFIEGEQCVETDDRGYFI